jgi:hypothetical protein
MCRRLQHSGIGSSRKRPTILAVSKRLRHDRCRLAHHDRPPFSGRPSLTGHRGHGWTCSLPRPVAIETRQPHDGRTAPSKRACTGPRSAQLFLLSRPPALILIAAPFSSRLSRYTAFSYFTTGGGLISYGPDIPDEFRRAATYVDRIFHGEKPGDLAVQQPIKFEMTITRPPRRSASPCRKLCSSPPTR